MRLLLGLKGLMHRKYFSPWHTVVPFKWELFLGYFEPFLFFIAESIQVQQTLSVEQVLTQQ